MIRRYAELSAAFVSVNEHCSDDTFHRLLSDMHMEIDHFILRLSSVFLQRKEQLIFAINNYDLILSVMGVSNTKVKVGILYHIQIFIHPIFRNCQIF